MLAAGEIAPDFTLPDAAGEPVTLSALLEEGPVVLYFYPRADTPGCTAQACGIRDRRREYAGAGARVVGISPDRVEEVAKFAAKHALEFTLLADAEHEVCDAYGVWGEKSMYGKRFWGAQRSTFIVGTDGRVLRAFPKVSPKTHDDVVLAALAEL